MEAARSAQWGITAITMTLYPFITCLLYQIKHDHALNPKVIKWRKIQLVTLLTAQLVLLTFMRDQYVWNEDVNQEKASPNYLLCGLSRCIFVYYLLINTKCS